MSDTDLLDVEHENDSTATAEVSSEDEKALAREARRQREIEAIKAAIASCSYVTKRDRVAGLLNMFPESRDSDVALTIRYWETFQSDIYTPGAELDPKRLFKLERLTTVARLRAKIQNEYGLFPASDGVRRKRRQKEEDVRDEMVSDAPNSRLISIVADEAGKQDEFVLVGSVWFLNAMKSAMFQHKVNLLRESLGIKNEFHFSRSGKQDVENYKAFVDLVREERDFISFKTIAAPRRGTSRNIEEVLSDLYCLLVLKGFDHEVDSRRVELPRRLQLAIDEGGITPVGCEMLSQHLSTFLDRKYRTDVTFAGVEIINSKKSAAVQLADMITGVVNRKLNYRGERSHKDDLADYVVEQLDLKLSDTVIGEDAFALIKI